MTQELSSNWKKLQAKLKAESSSTSASSTKGQSSSDISKKRKVISSVEQEPAPKKLRLKGRHLQPTGQKQHQPKVGPKQNNSFKKTKSMGVTQSSAIIKGTPITVTPSLALWAEDNDITTEDLAEAYNLGGKRSRPSTSATIPSTKVIQDRRRINEGLAPGVDVGKYIALDCEMVGVGPSGQDHMLARVSCVDFHGAQVYDSFVVPREPVTDYRTAITGITASTLQPPSARSFDEVQAAVADLLEGRILVGHDVRHDLAVLMLKHPTPQIRDTSRHSSFRKFGHGPKPALRVLAREVLGLEDFQTGKHSSIEDARVAMLLFRAKKSEFDVENASRYGMPSMEERTTGSTAKKSQGKKKKKKR
ncbi:ribonuclease H-like domain-containing protein [Xylariaceae sp. FL1651]|nr:ribonuclease H-like domain-containing protein [Xylariaceae sp. FL1651]